VNRIDALIHAYQDDSRPVSEREAALAVLRNLTSDGSGPEERQQAQAAVNSLEGNHPESKPCPLENELLFAYHTATLADVQHHEIHEFCTSHKFSADVDNLYLKWLTVSPVAQTKMRQMQKSLEAYFLESYETMVVRYKHGLDTGGDMSPLNKEALAFYRSWVDSVVMPEAMKPHFRQLIAALAARTGGHHDHQS
jgi:hypothetical protein